MCYLTLMQKEKQKLYKLLVVAGSSQAFLGMLDIETLAVITIHDKTIGRQLATASNTDKRQ